MEVFFHILIHKNINNLRPFKFLKTAGAGAWHWMLGSDTASLLLKRRQQTVYWFRRLTQVFFR